MMRCVLAGISMLILGAILGWRFHAFYQISSSTNLELPQITDAVAKGFSVNQRLSKGETVEGVYITNKEFGFKQAIEVDDVHSSGDDERKSILLESKGSKFRGSKILLSSSLKDVLSNSGIEQELVSRILDLIGKNKMDLLSLRDQAARNGWIDSDQYIEARAALADPSYELHTNLGSELYDHYLYAIGKDNRILIGEVYQNSQAEALGFLRGDMIIKYGQEYIFTMTDLIQATSGGDVGEPVLVEFQRDGMHMYETVQRGPLGIEMEAVSQIPIGSVKY